MVTILTRYIAGGYFLVKSVERPPSMAADLLPKRILSLSNCICPSVRTTWGWEEDELLDASDFGVADGKLEELHEWSVTGEIDFPNVFLTLAAARSFARDFLVNVEHTHLLGIGLPRDFADAFLTHKQTVYDPTSDTHHELTIGVSRMIADRHLLAPEGTPLGFEVLSYIQSLGHSWLCSGLERDMQQLFGIRPNAHGFIDTEAEAMQVYAWIAEDEQRGIRAEPEPYYPWLIMDYPLTENES